MKENRFCWEVHPQAVPQNTVQGKHYRFTVLQPQLIRLEYSPSGVFEDRASQVVFYRDHPVCPFEIKKENGILTLETEALSLRYQENAPFAADSLQLRLKQEPASCWCFGEDFETLGGTTSTLDDIHGRCHVENGVCSRNGFSVLDDSSSLLLEEDGWIGLRQEGCLDLYFFGFGYDYPGAVKALYKLTGNPPLLPAYALGNWWSRYFRYTQESYLELMDRFRQENIPFSVSVVDMDWHMVDVPEEQKIPGKPSGFGYGWTGYSWNKELFPDYKTFLKELHKRNLKTALNLHPSDGTRPHEDMYEQMAVANGIDPSSREPVRLDLLSREHMATYFDILHHPYEDDGVDFWWMDWQQGTDYRWIHEANAPGAYQDPREQMNPLWFLNHLHILDISRNGKRPMFFSRYCGPGSHRYPVGFSGDTTISWDSLQFQPEFTATASNIGYSWWSHDIGGHNFGSHDPELYVRWLQLGVFSPINRLHSCNYRFIHKEPWNYPEPFDRIASNWLRLRHSFFPYLYTMNYRNHMQGQPLVQPMYYSHPKCHEAYKVPTQFWFGSELMVAPITQPNDPMGQLGHTEVWLPKGHWFDFFTGLHYDGLVGRRMDVYRSMETMPVFAKAGAIVPMADYQDNRLTNSHRMQVLVFPGASNSFTLYKDAGDGIDYQNGAFATTRLELQWGETVQLVIHPAQGDLSLIPGVRSWKIGLRGFHRDTVVENGQWDEETNTLWVSLEVEADQGAVLAVTNAGVHDNRDIIDHCNKILRGSRLRYEDKSALGNILIKRIEDKTRPLRNCLVQLRKDNYVAGKALAELATLTEDLFI